MTLNFFTQYKKDGNDLLEPIITDNKSWIQFNEPKRKSGSMVWGKKQIKGRENSRMRGLPGR